MDQMQTKALHRILRMLIDVHVKFQDRALKTSIRGANRMYCHGLQKVNM